MLFTRPFSLKNMEDITYDNFHETYKKQPKRACVTSSPEGFKTKTMRH